MNVRTLLETEIQDEFKSLKGVDFGSEQYKTSVDGITKLTDRLIEFEKFDVEHKEKVENRKIENDFKLREMEDERNDRLIKNCLTGASIITGIGLTVWGTLKSLKFEENGSVTTIVGRGFINKLLPKK